VTVEPQGFGFVVGVRPDKRDEYLELHRSVWPTVEAALRAHNIRNYRIYAFGNVLFAYYEYVGEDYEGDMRRIGADPETQRWLTRTDPCQVRIGEVTDSESLWQPLEEIWHLQ